LLQLLVKIANNLLTQNVDKYNNRLHLVLPAPLHIVAALANTAPSNPNREPWKNTVKYAVLSDVGMRRANNQDSFNAMIAETKQAWETHGHVFLVADGMGAHAAGELASKLASELIAHHYSKLQSFVPAEGLHKSIAEANAEIYRRGQANIEFRNMGTTCSLLAMLPEGAVVAHVGDSRVYQLHNNQLFQLTFDHSLVWEMQAAGEVTDETARSGVIPKNVITRSLGPNPNVQIDLEGPFPISMGDRFLLCSDGLSGQITDEEIGAILRCLEPAEAAQLFIDLSNLRGGPDNITVIVAEPTDNRICTVGHADIAVTRRGAKRPFSVALGIVTAVCLLAGLTLMFVGDLFALAIVTFVLGWIALGTALAQVYWIHDNSKPTESRYGNGPYRNYKAEPKLALFEYLAGTMKALREAAIERQWKINWEPIDEMFRSARSSADTSDFSAAVKKQSMVIIKLMEQIKRQRRGDRSDSAIDL
jgi:PPM family protein phosphatase